MSTDARLFESVQILRLRPGDVLVVDVGRVPVSRDAAEEIRKRAEDEFPGHKIVVTYGVKFRVTREESP